MRLKFYLLKSLFLVIMSFVGWMSDAATHTQAFTASGSFTAPAGVTQVIVECWGGGGGGGAATGNPAAGGGGGGGAYAKSTLTVTTGTSYTVTVGSGGVSGAAGGSSSFGTSTKTSVLAAGGSAGGSATSSSSNGTAGPGALYGACTGDVTYSGGTGAVGNYTSGGAGGGAAGSNGFGGAASGATAGTGATLNGGNGAAGVANSTTGAVGSNYGGGGSGGKANSNTNQNGGAGAAGYVVITWQDPIPLIQVATTQVSSPCASDGTATVTITGGSGNYTYTWSTGAATASVTGLSTGSYTVIVKDNTYNYTRTISFEITTSTYNNVCPGQDGDKTTGGIVNTYYPPASASANLAIGATSITLGTMATGGATTAFAAGDLALIIQMQGTGMVTTNTSDYGTVSSVVAGQYEYVKVASVTGSTLTLATGLKNAYTNNVTPTSTSSVATYQIIRVPQYNSLTLSSNITALAWNGTVGGVVAMDVAGTLTMGGYSIAADYAGFRGGAGVIATSAGGTSPFTNDWVFPSGTLGHGFKGEGIAGGPNQVYNGTAIVTPSALYYANGTTYPGGYKGMGAAGNAAGGGNDDATDNSENSGGGGGSNLTRGGKGGNAWNTQNHIGGNGGYALSGSATQVFMGGGGGAGTANNVNLAHGGNGGGLVFVNAKTISGTGSITASGHAGYALPSVTGNDGGGGGGGGGTIVVTTDNYSGTLTLNASGGAGSNCSTTGDPHGPGGGGSGGAVYVNFNPAAQVAGGTNGTTTTSAIALGAESGATGIITYIAKSDLTNSTIGANCHNDQTAPTITCPGVCAGSVPTTYAQFTAAGGTAVDNGSGINIGCFSCVGNVVKIYDNAGNYSTCTITVNPLPTLTLTSGSASQTVCAGAAISSITYTFGGGATGANVSGLPSGLTSSVSGNVLTISGTPTAGGTYTVSTTGQTSPCTAVSLGGTITVNALPSAPTVISSSVTNTCPSLTVNLTALVTSSTPSGGSIYYKTSNSSSGTNVSAPTAVGAGTYYIFYSNSNGCYSATSATVTVTIQSCTDLQVSKTVDVSSPYVGGQVTFTITATNNGPSTATNVIVKDVLSPTAYEYIGSSPDPAYDSATGIWTINSLASGATVTLTIKAKVK